MRFGHFIGVLQIVISLFSFVFSCLVVVVVAVVIIIIIVVVV
jgi:hypothetical protein